MKILEKANATGVIYIDILKISKNPIKFIAIGINEPININIACFEKKPEFLTEYLSNKNNDIIYNSNV
jgi:hypothetical protein